MTTEDTQQPFIGTITAAQRHDQRRNELSLRIQRSGKSDVFATADTNAVDFDWPGRDRDLVSTDARPQPIRFTLDERGNVLGMERVTLDADGNVVE